MGDYEEHRRDVVPMYLQVSLPAVIVIIWTTGQSTFVLIGLLAGYLLLAAGNASPDTDIRKSRPRKYLNKIVTVGLGMLAIAWACFIVAERVVSPAVTVIIESFDVRQFVLVGLLLAFVVWMGYTSKHRTLTHSVAWGGVVTGLVFWGINLLVPLESWTGLVYAGVLSGYFFVGFLRHLIRDDALSLLWYED